MAWMLLIFVLSGPLQRLDERIEAELVELNHATSCDGVCRFDQVIVWKWSPDYRRWDAQYWAIVGLGGFHEYPVKRGEFYGCVINRDGRRVIIRGKAFRETWTVGDPERENAKLFPIEMRRVR